MSIGFLRRHQKRVFWPLAIIIIVTFVFWGAGSALFGRRSRETYAEIDGQALTYGELKRTAYIMLQLSGRPVSPDDVVRRMILNKAINNADGNCDNGDVK